MKPCILASYACYEALIEKQIFLELVGGPHDLIFFFFWFPEKGYAKRREQ